MFFYLFVLKKNNTFAYQIDNTMNTTTNFMDLKIKSPIIVGSCGLTSDIETLKKIEQAGAGAVILKSVFEEQIMQEMTKNVNMSDYSYSPESYDYVASHTQEQSLDKYVNLIKNAKKELSIPVIASVNCISASQWVSFASKMEQAGADGIELNMFILPSDVHLTTDDVERFYEDTIQSIRRAVSIPVSLKMSPYFSSLARFAQKVSWMGISNLHIFNRFAQQDINIDKICTEPANVFSTSGAFPRTLRWTAILSNIIHCPLTAGGGVHKKEDVIKLLLAGASSVQVVSAIYEQGIEFIQEANDLLKSWMQEKGFETIDDFRGKLAVEKNDKSSTFHRVQFMKYFANIE
jgi:dihydroorotate dehydrogenase (fumarate)